MGRVLDIIRRHLFWVLLGLVLLAEVAGYLFIVRPKYAEIDALRKKIGQNISTLKNWKSPSKVIPNERMRSDAVEEQKELDTTFGQALLLFTPLNGRFDRDFPVLANLVGPFSVRAAYDWWDEYKVRVAVLRKSIMEHKGFATADNALDFAAPPADPTPDLAQIKQVQRDYWVQQAIVEVLKAASPDTAPLIDLVRKVSVRGGTSGQLSHPWVRTVPFVLSVQLEYENLSRLLVALHNSAMPVLVSSYRVTRPRVSEAGADGAPSGAASILDVELSCELVEFLPAIHTVAFSGQMFRDGNEVRKWLLAENEALRAATSVLMEGVPSLRRRAEAVLGQSLAEFKASVEKGVEARLREIRAAAAEELKNELAGYDPAELTPEKRKEIEARNKKTLEEQLSHARKAVEQAELDFAEKAGGFSLAYVYFYPLLPQKAYFVGAKALEKNLLCVRAPFGRADWWLARHADTIRKEEKEVFRELQSGRPPLTAVEVDKAATDRVVLFVDRAAGIVVKIALGQTGGTVWRVFDVVQAEGSPATVSDVAFRFAPAIQAAAAKAAVIPPESSAVSLTVTPEEELSKNVVRDIEVPVGGQDKSGIMKIQVRLRK